MNAFKEAIRSGLEEYLQGLKRAIEGLTPAEARWQPTLNTNHIAWLVWHMARVEDRWVSKHLKATTEVWVSEGWADRFKMDSESLGFGHSMEDVRAIPDIPLSDLVAYFDAVRAVTHRYLYQATDADLLKEYASPHRGTVRGTWILGHILVEESQHVGQVSLIRGMMRGVGT
jgi:uncharacterized damage-inducible protein DinB